MARDVYVCPNFRVTKHVAAMPINRHFLPCIAILAMVKGSMRRVLFVAVPPVQIIDLTAPYEIFARCGGIASNS